MKRKRVEFVANKNSRPVIVQTIDQIPHEVTAAKIAPCLTQGAMLNLTASCRFFLNEFSDARKNAFPPYRISIGSIHHFILYPNGDALGLIDPRRRTRVAGDDDYLQAKLKKLSFHSGEKFRRVVGGNNTSFIISEKGDLLAFGENSFGQSGLGHTNYQSIPQKVTFPTKAKLKEIVTGLTHTLALFENGEVFTFGGNTFGQLGLGHTKHQSTPQRVDLPSIGKVDPIVRLNSLVGAVQVVLATDNLH